MNLKHTPGPWFIPRPNGYSTIYVEARIGGGMLQEVAACGPTEAGVDQQRANACLIASAPDLLEALEKLTSELVLSDVNLDYMEAHFRPCLTKAYAAIARATGETK